MKYGRRFQIKILGLVLCEIKIYLKFKLIKNSIVYYLNYIYSLTRILSPKIVICAGVIINEL